MFPLPAPDRPIARILRADRRYPAEAYEFTRRAVSYATEVLYEAGHHVSGRQLLEAIRCLALREFGLLAREVLASWGVRKTEDFGEIVFNLVGSGLLSRTEEDTKADFRSGYSFDEVFHPADYWSEVLESST